MAIALPRFEDTFCRMFGLCAHIVEVAPGSPALPQEDLDLTSSNGPRKTLIRLIWDFESKHLHVDVALRSAFGKNPPKTNTPLRAFLKTLASFEGARVRAHLHGYFLIPLTSLPPTGGLIFTGGSAIRLRSGKSEIELTGATLTFHDAEIERLRWDISKDTVVIDLVAERELRVAANYLTDALKELDSATSNYILGKKADDQAGA